MKFVKFLVILIFGLTGYNLKSQPFLPPPDSLVADQYCDFIDLRWHTPDIGELLLLGYNVYFEDSLMAFVQDTNYHLQMRGDGFAIFQISAIYAEGPSYPSSLDVELVNYAPATNLTYDEDYCTFHWKAPIGNLPETFYYCEKVLDWCSYWQGTSIGTDEDIEFEVSSVWSPENLAAYSYGYFYLTGVRFWPSESHATYIVMIYQSMDNEDPDSLLYSQVVEDISINQWNDVELIDSIYIDIAKFLWVGYQIIPQHGYPAGVDDGPVVDCYRNMIFWQDHWQTLLNVNPDLDYNWLIEANFTLVDTTNFYYDIYGYYDCYDFYDRWVKLNEYPVSDTFFWFGCVFPLNDSYLHLNNCFVQVQYCHEVVNSDTAEYDICFISNIDPGEQNSIDQVLILNSGGNWIIRSGDLVTGLKIYDMAGRIIYQNNNSFQEISIYNQDLSPGIYLVEIFMHTQRIARKIVR